MRDWLIKKLGGVTQTELDLNNQKWENIILDEKLLNKEKMRLVTNQYYDRVYAERFLSYLPNKGKK